MKNWISIGFLSVLIIGMILISGCTSTAAAATPTPQIVYVTMLVTQIPTPTFVQSRDTIIGVWRASESDSESAWMDVRYRFNADGTFLTSWYVKGKDLLAGSGTWIAKGNNSYELRYSNGKDAGTIIYDPAKNAIYPMTVPTLFCTPYQGDVMGDLALSLTSSPSVIQTASSPVKVIYPPATAIPTPVPTITPGDSNFTLPIIIILIVLFLAGGGYALFQMKRKPSGDQPPVKEPGREQPLPTAPSTGYEDLPNRIASVEQKESVLSQFRSPVQDIPPIESAITELETLNRTAKPELTLSLDRTQLSAEKWHKLGITLTNTGSAHVENVIFTFSSEFETKGIKPISVKAGESSHTEIRILPKNAGNVLLDVTLTYKDHNGMEYRKVQEIAVDVVEKGTTTAPSSETPPSPVSQFTPKPLTPKQLPPELSNRYTESEFIGKGGFARVFKAKRKDGKLVAVKIPISMDAATGKSFIAEMQNWTKLSHPNIVRLYDFNIMPMPYFEEELCDSALADQSKPIESEEAAWILFNVCEGLKFAHAGKIIHRDLKPQNILLKNGVPKISDWGLSSVISESTSTTSASFTPYYAAPEQISSNHKDERTDIWQLGVIFYELVTGKLPFTGDSIVNVMAVIVSKNPTQPSLITSSSQDVEAMIMKCLKKNPDRRYQSVLELQKELALYLRITYTESLKMSMTANDIRRSAFYCGDLVMVNLLTGDMKSAYKYILDLVHYSKGDVKVEAQELSEQIKMRMEMGVTEIPDELITKAELIVHQVSVGFRKKGQQR